MARDEGRGVEVPEGLRRERPDAGARAPGHALQEEEPAEAVARLHLCAGRAGAAGSGAGAEGRAEPGLLAEAALLRASLRTTSEMSSAKRGPRTLYPRAQLLPEPLCARRRPEEGDLRTFTAVRRKVGTAWA